MRDKRGKLKLFDLCTSHLHPSQTKLSFSTSRKQKQTVLERKKT